MRLRLGESFGRSPGSTVRRPLRWPAVLSLGLLGLIAAAAPASGFCHYYASPAGGGDGLSPTSPFRVFDFWAKARPGIALCLLDGTYTGDRSMIRPPQSLAGKRGLPIVVRALNDGKVLVSGEGARAPVRLLDNDWFLIEGLNACCSNETVVSILRSNHNTVRRVAAWDAADGNHNIFGVHYGQHNLLEDVAGWGVARKTYESSYGGDFTTIRRAWGRWEGSHVVGPKMVYSLAYNNYDMLVENSIGTWSGERMRQTYVLLAYDGQPWTGKGAGTYTNYAVDQPYAVFGVDGLAGDKNARARLLGSLAYVGSGDRFAAHRLVFVTKLDSVEVRQTAAYFDTGTNLDKKTFGLYQLEDGSDPKNAVAAEISGFGGGGSAISVGWRGANRLQTSSPSAAYGAAESLFNSARGANLCHRYQDGIRTARPLWPWPMNERILEATARSGRAPVDVTAAIERMFGPIPAPCRERERAPLETARVDVPVAGHVTGVGGLTFVTDLQIQNPGEEPASARLRFRPAGASAESLVHLLLAPRQTLVLEDAVASVFGLDSAIGSLRLESAAQPADSLRMTSRVYTRNGEGTLGQAVSGVPAFESPPGSARYVTGLVQDSLFRCNLGAVNVTALPHSFRVRLRGPDGTLIGASASFTLAPGRPAQWALSALFPGASGKGLTAEFDPSPESPAPLAYASVVDNLSGDGTYYSSLLPSAMLHLPGVARVDGAGGSRFRSDIALANPTEDQAVVTVTFLVREKDNRSAPARTLTLAPRETRTIEDVLDRLFGLSETYGALQLQVSGAAGIVVAERLYTPSPSGAGTVGQQIDPVSPEGFLSRGSVLGLRQDEEYRSNVGLLNPNALPVAVALRLLAEDGRTLAERVVSIPPRSYLQRSLPALFPALDAAAGSSFSLSVETGGDPIFPFATVVDNASQDPTFSAGLK